MRIAIPLLAAFIAAAPLRAECVVTTLEVLDHSRTVGIPFSSSADSGAIAARVRALVWSRGSARVKPTYADLIRDMAPGVNAAEHLASRLRFYGATVDSAVVAAGVSARSACGRSARPMRPKGGVVLIVGAFPAALYEGAAAALAEHDIATVVTSGNEGTVRLVVNHLATLGWPVDKLALVGHGAGGPVVQLVAMSSSGVRGIVSLDGFEALDRQRHPGLAGDPQWRPGNLRAPVLHWRPNGHPDADTAYYAAAARSDLLQVTLTATPGKQWLTAPEVALAPAALRHVIGAPGAATQEAVTKATVLFLRAVLEARAVDPGAMRATFLPSFAMTHRPAMALPQVRADGRLDEAVWRTARVVPESTAVAVRVADDCDYLYVAVMPRRATPFITELFLSATSDVYAPLGAGDLLLHASASLCWTFGKPDVASSDCNKSEAWWGASRTSQAGDPAVAEYVIAKRAMGLARCESSARLRLGALAGGWGRTDVFPAGADKSRRSTWAAAPR